MKNLFFKGCLFSLALLIGVVFSYAEVNDRVPKKINVQGKLTTDSGQPITGSKNVKLYIYGSDKSTIIAQPETTVTVDSDGLYDANLAVGNIDFNNEYYFKVEAGGVSSSIRPFASSPNAFHASKATYALVLSTGTDVKLIDDNFTRSDSSWSDSNTYKIAVGSAVYSKSASEITIPGADGQVWGMNGSAQGWIDSGSLNIAPATVEYIGGLKLKNTDTGLGMMSDGSINSILKVNLDTNAGLKIDTANKISIAPATDTNFGVVKVTSGNGLSLATEGTNKGKISMALANTNNEAGAVKVSAGNGLNYNDGAISLSAVTVDGTIPGTMKLYSSTGNSEDGTMTQNAITSAITSGTANMVTTTKTQTLTNKTINATNNTISNIATSNFGSGVIVTSVGNPGADTSIPTEKAIRTELDNKESTSNKVTSITSSSTDEQYPSAKAVYDIIPDVSNFITANDNVATATTASELGSSQTGFDSSNVKFVWAKDNNDKQGWYDVSTVVGFGADLAEIYRSKENLQPGDVVSIDTTRDDAIIKTKVAEDTLVAGVISTDPGLLLNSAEKGYKLALVGKVPTKVCNEGGEIKRGDLLVSASIAGYAKKAGDNPKAGTVIGKALENFSSKRGTILVLVNLQ